MKLSQIHAALSIAARVRRAAMIWGQPGIGKSDVTMATARHAAAALNLKGVATYGEKHEDIRRYFGLHDVRLSQCETVDIRGLPHISGTATSWSVPDWFPHTDADNLPDAGILFFDELNGAPQSVQAACYQVILDRRIGDKVMKPGWSIVMAGNRLTDGGVTFKMPLPLCNRVIHLNAECDVDEWCGWAMDNQLPVEVIAFIRFRPDLLNTFEDHVTKKKSGNAFCTPRSWHVASDVIATKPAHDVLFDILNGTLGEGPAAEFIGFMQVWAGMPSIDGILLDPAQAKVPEDAATLFAVTAALANRMHPDTASQVCQYLERVPEEFSVLCMRDSLRRAGPDSGKLLSAPAITKWMVRNAQLLGVSA